jgi:VIT1/CCC1 family predicted Fe2+/Mn2+ transporter
MCAKESYNDSMQSQKVNSAHSNEQHVDNSGPMLNWLRAAVLGANDGIVSVAALVVGVAGATDHAGFILTAGIAGLLAGALSMAVGEYVSVSTQRDTEQALLLKERWELENEVEKELEELTEIYQNKGLSRATAEIVAKELTTHDAFAAHVDAELHIDPDNLTNPLHAAYASGASFTAGALIPLAAIVLLPAAYRIPATFTAVLLALMVTGSMSAYAGGANKTRATIRVVVGGALAMAITFGIGKLFGVRGI